MVLFLLEHNADVNAPGMAPQDSIHLASFEGFLDVSRLLIEHGADVDAQDNGDLTPF